MQIVEIIYVLVLKTKLPLTFDSYSNNFTQNLWSVQILPDALDYIHWPLL